MDYKLEDLIDINLFQNLQDKLNSIYSFPSAIIDNEGNILTAVAWQDVCTKFHRKNRDCEKECIKSDQYILEHLHEANPAVSYTCPHGLIDNATPIIINGKHLGNFFTGQFFLEEPDLNFFKKQAKIYGFDETEYLDAVRKVPVWTKEKLIKYLDFIKGFIEIIAGIGLKNLKEKEINKALRKSEEQNRTILQTAIDGFWLTDYNGNIIDVNEAYCRMSGYCKPEILAMKISDLEAVESTEDVNKHMEKLLQVGEDRFFTRHRRKDGSVYDVEVSVKVVAELNNYIVVFLRDISERKKAEAELIEAKEKAEESERKLKESQAIAKLGSWELDVEKGLFTFTDNFYSIYHTNAKEMGGYQMSVHDYSSRFVHPDDASMVAEETNKAVETDDPDFSHYVEHRILYHDGGIGYIGVRYFVRKDKSGKTIKTYGVNQDITERKQIEIELLKAKDKAEESDRLKTAFLQNMSHEIRTPLNAISGFSGMLNKPSLSDEKRNSFVSIIQNSSKQLISIVSDILTISSLETKQEKINISKVCINNIIVDLLAIFKQQAQNQNISLYAKQQLSDKQSEIFTDKTKITQILSNLLSNALKFTHEGFIEFGYGLKTENEPVEIEFYVKDTGIGIKPEFHGKIFERFSQADISINKLYGGTGLGLAISKALVELLGGKIRVQSEIGKGSTFYFKFPYQPVDKIDIIPSSSKHTENIKTILVAEDEEYIFLFIEELLIDMNLKLIHAKDGRETIEILTSNPNIDLILMDIKMPIMDGHTAAKIIKEQKPDIPIVAQSAYALEHERAKYQEIFDDYITKPIDHEILIQKVMKYVYRNNL